MMAYVRRLTPYQIKSFRKLVYNYFRVHKRSLPWRNTKDPYKILISEVMLQQTQVSRVVEKYKEFMQAFPTVRHLASAPLHKVMISWQGLGYNRRALLLKKTAKTVVADYNAKIPESADILKTLPGIGRATACSICVFAFNQQKVFIETNIRSVFLYHFFNRRSNVSDAELLPFIEATLDRKSPQRWYSALMDYGSFLKSIMPNPNRKSRHYKKQSRFQGSDRQLRGAVLRMILKERKLSFKALLHNCSSAPKRTEVILAQLCKEGLIHKNGTYYLIE